MAMELIIYVLFLSFLFEYIDSSLGMGYGTTLTPVLLLIGYSPLQVVPAILLSQFIAGITVGFFHHRFENVNFSLNSKHLKIALILSLLGIIGTFIGVMVVVGIPSWILKVYIGTLVFLTGIVVLITRNKRFKFSWIKITFLALIASFNKGVSGGGYGPIVTSGQILSGIKEKNSIGITAFSEGIICLAGVLIYISIKNTIDWSLAPSLIIGATLSVPLSAFTVKVISSEKLRKIVGIMTIALGLLTILKFV